MATAVITEAFSATEEHRTGALRFVSRLVDPGTLRPVRILQQEYIVKRYDDGTLASTEVAWRDVPLVDAEG